MEKYGGELKLDPYLYPDGEGGLRFRVTLPDGTLYWRQVSRKFALRTASQLTLHVARLEEGRGS